MAGTDDQPRRGDATEELGRARGPGLFFVDHPTLFAMSVTGAWAASAYSLARAGAATGRRRVGLLALGLVTAGEGIGIVVARRRARG